MPYFCILYYCHYLEERLTFSIFLISFYYFCLLLCNFFFNCYFSLQTKCSTVSEEVTETGTEEIVEKPLKKKKKKKTDPEPYEVESDNRELADFADVTVKEETNLQINNTNGFQNEEPKKKKKKRHQEDQDPVFQGSDSSGYQSDHKKRKKKRKHSEEAEFTPLLEHSSKKKREK